MAFSYGDLYISNSDLKDGVWITNPVIEKSGLKTGDKIVSVDGISLPLVMLTAFVSPVAILGTWPALGVELKKEKFFVIMLMFLQTGMYGTFLSSDLFLFYFF